MGHTAQKNGLGDGFQYLELPMYYNKLKKTGKIGSEHLAVFHCFRTVSSKPGSFMI